MLIERGETFSNRGTIDSQNGEVLFQTGYFARASRTQEDAISIPIPLYRGRVFDAVTSHLPATAASDDLGIYNGAGGFGTDAITLRTSDADGLTGGSALSQKVRFIEPVSLNYVLGETFTVRVRHGMITTASNNTSTVDVQFFIPDKDGSVGSDLCTTTAITSNTLGTTSYTNRDFTISPGSLLDGDIFDMVVTLDIDDTGSGTAVIGEITSVELILDIRR